MSNNGLALVCGGIVWVCNEAAQAGWLNWWLAVPAIMVCMYLAARLITARKRGRSNVR